jgi:hypothetical protein
VRQVNHDEDVSDVAIRRDKIAQDMWNSYQSILEARAQEGLGDEDEDDDDNEEMLYEDDNFITV